MHHDSRLLAQGNQDELLRHEQALRLEIAKIQYRVAMLEACLEVGPQEREALKQIFKEDTGEDLLEE